MERKKSDDFDQDGNQAQNKILVEAAFRNTPVPPWTKQITVRAMATSFILSIVFNFIVCKLNLTTGVIPSLNVAAGLLGFAVLRAYTIALTKVGLLKQPFTRQENCVIQTCVVASSGIAFSRGYRKLKLNLEPYVVSLFGLCGVATRIYISMGLSSSGTASYILGMSGTIAAQGDEGNTPINVKNPHIGWMIGFLFTVSFLGLFSIMPMRKMMIMEYKLTYPSGTATAYLINSFHTPKGAKLAKKQVGVLFKSFCFSFVWAFFQWFYTAADGCGFASFPTFGLQAYAQKFYFDFSSTYVGVGMICPYMVNISLLVGSILSWGIMWPLIEKHKGNWYSADLSASSLHGIQGYRVFIAIAMMLGDGLYHVAYMLFVTFQNLCCTPKTKEEMKLESSSPPSINPASTEAGVEVLSEKYDEERRVEYFLKDAISHWVAFGGYVALAIISIITVPSIFRQLKWYHIFIAYLVAPVLAFCNSYGTGLTDWSLASNYGKFAIIIFSAWVGPEGGVVAGLAACGVMMSIVATASDLMQDFKTGYLTLSSPRSMFFSQVLGTAMGCLMSPLVFWIFYKAYPLGDPNGSYPAPFALMYRGMALLGVEGVGSLPKNCVKLAVSFFVAAVVINLITELLKRYETKYRLYRFIPSPMCMAIPFYLGSYFAIDMCLGSLILFLWQRMNKQKADDFAPAVASGLICGESLWGIPAAILSLANVKPPICMKFLSASANEKVEKLLSGH